jgi:hypothetical protein
MLAHAALLAACDRRAPPAPPARAVVELSSASPEASAPVAAKTPCEPVEWPDVSVPDDPRMFEGLSGADAHALAAASPALRTACARIEREAKQHLSSIWAPGSAALPYAADKRKAILDSTTMGCFGGSSGAWALQIGAFRSAPVGDVAIWQLEYLTADAHYVTGSDARGDLVELPGDDETDMGIAGVLDLDGDGAAEVVVTTSGISAAAGGSVPTQVQIFAVEGGALVVAFAPVPGRRIVGALDADHDGRIDLVLDAPTPLPELAHALAGGGHALDDAVARAFLHVECARPLPPPPRDPLQPPPPMGPTPAWPPGTEQRVAAQCAVVRSMDTCGR